MRSSAYIASLFFAIFLVVTTKEEDHFDDGSAETRCGDDGPPIRFPFSLTNVTTSSSGYPGFELSCSDRKDTVLHLPHGGKFWVTAINYTSQELIVSDPDGCIVPRLPRLNLSSSPFLSMNHLLYYNYTLINCSSTNNDILKREKRIECLSIPGYNVFFISSDSYYYKSDYEPFTYLRAAMQIQEEEEEDLGSPDDDHDNGHDNYDTECLFIPKSHAKGRLIKRVLPALGLLGLVIAAVVTAKRRYNASRLDKLERVNQAKIENRIHEAGKHLKMKVESENDEKIAKKLSIIGLWCIQWYPVDRPSMSSVIQMLEEETDKLSIPPNPFASNTTTPENNTRRNIHDRPGDHHALDIISEHDELE
ncbi:hypothetical protein Sjap_021096 [Stephania japonica]|uniref:RING-type E3 ubiquitin transferase n=1 Tax=Stephania japonica TaxID=461633 RepID=A0AAP0HZK0_9MAGN